MPSRIVGRFRRIEVLVVGAIVVVGTLVLVGGGSFAAGIGIYLFAAFAALMFELRVRGLRATIARVRGELQSIGEKDFEAPVPVQDGDDHAFIEALAANSRIAAVLARRSVRMFVSGTWRGGHVELGTTILPGRDFDMQISYVRVDAPQTAPFRVMSRGAVTSVSRLGMSTHETKTGDAAFDEGWVVDGDEALCRSVLDAQLRATLVDLRARLAWLQTASIESTRFGLVVRWPGEMSPGSAAYLRDLAISIRDRLASAGVHPESATGE